MGQVGDGASHASVDVSVDPDGAPVVSLRGELDMSNVETIEAELGGVIATAAAVLVFDLSALEFIDSSGIALLLRAAEKVGRIELRNPSDIVRRVIQATGLSDVLHVQP
jgi:stage II sporulation protein AA (anti-sigma F factor antagonist)